MLCALAALTAGNARAQAYPVKPMRIIVSTAAGGGSDFIARLLAQKLIESLGQQVIIENRPGAGGTLGIESGIRSAPDGYTLNLVTPSYSINPSLYNLDNEINEQTNLAAKYPEIVAKLKLLAEKMNAEVGGDNPSSRRPAGHVQNPKTLYQMEVDQPRGKNAEKPASKP